MRIVPSQRGGERIVQSGQATEPSHGAAIRTFLIADVRGYTAFTAEHGDEAAAALASRFAELTRSVVGAHDGQLVELRGDEALVVFESARQAIRAAIELQARFVDATVADPELPLPVGIGLDAGEAVPVEHGYRGGALNLAARLCSMAAPAEILASREVVHLARKMEGVTAVDRGAVRLKGLPEPVHVVRLRAEAEDGTADLAFRRALGPSAARLVPAASGAMSPNPYKGLRAFEEADAADFFGREELTRQLVQRLRGTRFLAVVGPSGSGKSSVVRAGLIPAVRQGALGGSDATVVAEMLPGPHPLAELEAALLRIAANPPASLMEQLERDDQGFLRAAKRVLPAGASELVLFIDQFEEIFTLVADEATRTHLLDSLQAAVTDPHSRLRVVATLRADFYDRPLLYRGSADLFRSYVEVVVPLSPEELERTIVEPARRADVRLEQGLVAQMLADSADEPGALPLLEYALTELFDRRDGGALTLEAYRAIGGVSGALGRRAEELYAGLDDDGREAARQVFLRLVALGEGAEDTRRRVPRSELLSLAVEKAAVAVVIDAFGAARLLTFDRDSGSGAPTVELAHEALLTAWRRLRGWIDEAREDLRIERRLAGATREWLDAGREPSFLATGSRLDQFEASRRTGAVSLTDEEREFLEVSIAERDRHRAEEAARQARELALERRSVRRLRALVAVLAVTALVAAGLTAFAFDQQGRAEHERRIAGARELAAAAIANLEVDPERSTFLALEAVAATRSVDGSVLPEAEEALHRAVVANRIELTVPGLGGSLDWSPDGTAFVTEGPEESGMIDIRDARTGERRLEFRGHDVDINDVAFSPDGSMLATTGDDGSAKVWDPATGEELWTFRGTQPADVVMGPSFDPGATRLAATWIQEGMVRVYDLDAGRSVLEIGPIAATWETAFSPDGERLAIAVADPPGAVVVDLASGDELLALEGHEEPVIDVDWSPDGRWISTASGDATARIWDAATGEPRFILSAHIASLISADWSTDSSRLVTSSEDGTARLWEISEDGPRELFRLSAQDTAGGVSANISPDGERVITGDVDIRAVKIWDVSIGGDAEWANLPVDPIDLPNVTVTPDGGSVVTTAGGAAMTVWDAGSWEETRTIGPAEGSGDPGGPLMSIDVSADGQLVAAGGPAPHVWDLRDASVVFRVDGGFAEEVSWSPDGRLLAAALPDDGLVRIVDRAGREVAVLRQEDGFIPLGVRFAPGGDRLATIRWPIGRPVPSAFAVQVWDWQRGEVVRTFQTQADAAAFDPTGRLLATGGSFDPVITIWEVETGRAVAELSGHAGAVTDVAFSPDGSRVASASRDGTVRLWDATSGAQQLVLRGHGAIVWDTAFTPDGTKLLSAAPGQVRVWALDIDDLTAIAREELTRELTDEECRQYLHAPCPGPR